jgi:hypothetical protein
LLSQLRILEIEELYDGTRFATYTTATSIAADPTAGCQLAIFRHYGVTIELGCEARIFGGSTPIAEMVGPENPKAPAVSLSREDIRSTLCARRRAGRYDPAGLPRDTASGIPCIWQSEFVRRSMARAGLPAGEPATTDVCLYAARPSYPAGRGEHLVVLKNRHSNLSMTGLWLPSAFGETAGVVTSLKEFSPRATISSDRFAEPAARRFLGQPAKSGLSLP